MQPSRLLLLAGLLLPAACSSLPERDFFTLLPENSSSTISTTWFGQQTVSVTRSLHRKGQHCNIVLQYEPPHPGYKLKPELLRQAYGSLIGREHTEPLAPFITGSSEKTMQLTVPATCFRHSGGPWDYSLRLNFTSPDGTVHTVHDVRLYSDCPEPGALRNNPHFFDKTYDRNKESLEKLQQAALTCCTMRLFTHDFHSGKKSTQTISPTDVAALRHIIAHLQPVSTRHALINWAAISKLQLLNADGTVIGELPTARIASPHEVSPENVALMGYYMLQPQDESTWNTILSNLMR